MNPYAKFSTMVLFFLLSWTAMVCLIVAVHHWASLAGFALLFAMVVIAWMVTATDKAR